MVKATPLKTCINISAEKEKKKSPDENGEPAALPALLETANWDAGSLKVTLSQREPQLNSEYFPSLLAAAHVFSDSL